MTPLDLTPFLGDLWWVVLIKALFAFVLLLVLTLFTIWYERRSSPSCSTARARR